MQNIPYWRISEWDVLFLKENTKNMKQITEEQIDSIINSVFIEQNENNLNNYIKNYEGYKKVFAECVMDLAPNAPSDYAERFSNEFSMAFAAFKLAQDNCVSILKETLKVLLCEPSDDRIKDKKGESNVQ